MDYNNTKVDKKHKDQCSGCSLCAEICPKKAITMRSDEEGFVYPRIDENTCIECGLCERKCSFVNNLKVDTSSFFIGRTKDPNVLKDSASGGIFTVLSDYVFNQEGVVYGAVYDALFEVVHVEAKDQGVRNRMRDSKYVQSRIDKIYSYIEVSLRNNKLVLFSGTPCQCNAISNFVDFKKLNRDKLILVDLVCHGVGSPLIWREYLNHVTSKYHLGNIFSIKTRNKAVGTGYNLTISGEKKQYLRKGNLDPYICLFNKSLIFRSSCYNCPFKSWNRTGDITIGDFQKVRKFFPLFADKKGVSLIIANTKKGLDVVNAVLPNLDSEPASRESSSQVNLSGLVLDPTHRNHFFNLYKEKGFNYVLEHFTNEGVINRVIYYLKYIGGRLIHVFK